MPTGLLTERYVPHHSCSTYLGLLVLIHVQGTWQFMSTRILRKPHLLHGIFDDIESVFWVLLFVALHHFKHEGSVAIDLFDEVEKAPARQSGPSVLTGGTKKIVFLMEKTAGRLDFHSAPLNDLIVEISNDLRLKYMGEDADPVKVKAALDRLSVANMIKSFEAALQRTDWPNNPDRLEDQYPRQTSTGSANERHLVVASGFGRWVLSEDGQRLIPVGSVWAGRGNLNNVGPAYVGLNPRSMPQYYTPRRGSLPQRLPSHSPQPASPSRRPRPLTRSYKTRSQASLQRSPSPDQDTQPSPSQGRRRRRSQASSSEPEEAGAESSTSVVPRRRKLRRRVSPVQHQLDDDQPGPSTGRMTTRGARQQPRAEVSTRRVDRSQAPNHGKKGVRGKKRAAQRR